MVKVPVPRAALFPIFKVPANIVAPPENVFTPFNVQEPASSFVKTPVPFPKILVSVPPAAPPNVNPKPEPVIVPTLETVIAPVPPSIEAEEPNVTKPLYVHADPEFIKAPPLEIPVPFKVRASKVVVFARE